MIRFFNEGYFLSTKNKEAIKNMPAIAYMNPEASEHDPMFPETIKLFSGISPNINKKAPNIKPVKLRILYTI